MQPRQNRRRVIIDIGAGRVPLVLKRKPNPRDLWLLIDLNQEVLLEAKERIRKANLSASVEFVKGEVGVKGRPLVTKEGLYVLKDGKVLYENFEKRLPVKTAIADKVECRALGEEPIVEVLAKEIGRIIKPNGTATVSLFEHSPARVVEAFERAGFKLVKINQKAETPWEKWAKKTDTQRRKIAQKNAVEYRKKGLLGDAEFAEHMAALKGFNVFKFKKAKT